MSEVGRLIDPEIRLKLRDDVGIEDFGASSLVLLCDSMQLREINESARRLLDLIDGSRTVSEIAEIVSEDSGFGATDALAIVSESLLEMERQGIVVRLVRINSNPQSVRNNSLLVSNPGVVLWQNNTREAVLFIPDTADYIMLNETAVEIWKALSSPVTISDLVEHLERVCSDIPMERIEQEIREFLEYLVEKKFAGEMEITR